MAKTTQGSSRQANSMFITRYGQPASGKALFDQWRSIITSQRTWMVKYKKLALSIWKSFEKSPQAKIFESTDWYTGPRFPPKRGQKKGQLAHPRLLPQDALWARTLLFQLLHCEQSIQEGSARDAAESAHMATEYANRIIFGGFEKAVERGGPPVKREREALEENIRNWKKCLQLYDRKLAEDPNHKITAAVAAVRAKYKVSERNMRRIVNEYAIKYRLRD